MLIKSNTSETCQQTEKKSFEISSMKYFPLKENTDTDVEFGCHGNVVVASCWTPAKPDAQTAAGNRLLSGDETLKPDEALQSKDPRGHTLLTDVWRGGGVLSMP